MLRLEETALAFFMIKNWSTSESSLASPRAVEPDRLQMFDAEPLQIGYVLLQSADGFVSLRPAASKTGPG